MKTFQEFMVECYVVVEGNPTTRMITKSNTKLIGHISADRGSDESKNRKSRGSLENDLQKHGIGYQKGVGEYKYSSGEGTGREVGLVTSPRKSKPGSSPMSKRRFGKIMRRLGRKHGQESVITKDSDKPAKLHTTEKGSKDTSITLGKSLFSFSISVQLLLISQTRFALATIASLPTSTLTTDSIKR